MNRKTRLMLTFLFCAALGISGFAHAPQEKFVNVFGAKIRYLEAGDPAKPAIFLLHGLGGNADISWLLNIEPLAADYHVIAPDQIGFGKSDKPQINYRIGTYVDFLDKMMSELKIEKASLAGHSMGGWTAALYAAKYPAKVDKLVLVDSAGYAPLKDFDYRILQNLNPSTRDGVRAMIKQLFYNSAYFSTDANVDQFIVARIAANDGNTIQTLLRTIEIGDDYFDARLKTIKTPTLILWGKQDGLVPLSEGERLKNDIAGSQIIVFDQAGHFPQVERAAEFNKALIDFLKK